MGDPGVLCTDAGCNFKCAFEREMRDVPSSAHTVDDEMLKALKFGKFLFRYMVHVCAICKISETVTKNRKFEMLSPYRYYLHSFDAERIAEIIAHDKKSQGDTISVVMCDEIGSFYFRELTVNEIMKLI